MSIMRRFVVPLLLAASAALSGCATNPRFDTALPSERITGEEMCEVPQPWKALALKGVDTDKLDHVTVVQVRMTPEWIGDALGWPVPVNDREVKYLPRLVWTALLITKSGEKRFYPAVAKNPFVSPYFTVIIPDRSAAEVNGGDRVSILSGAHTKMLTTSGDTISLRPSKDCISSLDEEFFKMFPSVASGAVEYSGDDALVHDLKRTFPGPLDFGNGEVYSAHVEALSRGVSGDVRQATFGERFREQGGGKFSIPIGTIPVAAVIGNVINNAVPAILAIDERYVGPFGERQYTAEEAELIIVQNIRSYSAYIHKMERRLGRKETSVLPPVFSWGGRRTGWQIARDLYLDIEDMWSRAEGLQSASARSKTVQSTGLLAGGPNSQGAKK